MSEAYNAPAPTTGNYPLKLKRLRPPKAKKPAKEVSLKLTPQDVRNMSLSVYVYISNFLVRLRLLP